MIVNQTQLAEILGLSTRQIRNLEAAGLPHEAEGNSKRYALPHAIAWYVARKVQEAVNRAERTPFDEAKARKAAAEADLKEAELAKVRGTTVALDWMEEQFAEACSDLAAAIQTMPVRHGRMVNPDEPDAGVAALEAVADDLLERLSQAFQVEDGEDAAA